MIPVIGFDPSKDPLAERITYAGQRVNQGLTNFANGMTNAAAAAAQRRSADEAAARQESQFTRSLDATQESNRIKLLRDDLDAIDRHEDDVVAAGQDPVVAKKFGDKERAKVRERFRVGAPSPEWTDVPIEPAGKLSLETDPLAAAPSASFSTTNEGEKRAEPAAAAPPSLGNDPFTSEMPDYERGSIAKEPPPTLRPAAAPAPLTLENDAFATPPAAGNPATAAPALSLDNDPLGAAPATGNVADTQAPEGLSWAWLKKDGLDRAEKKRLAEAGRLQKVEEDKNVRELREQLDVTLGYTGYLGKIPGLPAPEELDSREKVLDAAGKIRAYVQEQAARRNEMAMRAAQGDRSAGLIYTAMNTFDNDGEVTKSLEDYNESNSAMNLAAQAEHGDASAQSLFRRKVASMYNRGALSDSDVRDVVGDSSLDVAKKTLNRWFGGDEMALTTGQLASLKKVLLTKRKAAIARYGKRVSYHNEQALNANINWSAPTLPDQPDENTPTGPRPPVSEVY